MVMAYIWTGMVLTAVLFSFWSGAGSALSVGRVMECAGLNRILARGLEPVIGRLFPSARKDPKV